MDTESAYTIEDGKELLQTLVASRRVYTLDRDALALHLCTNITSLSMHGSVASGCWAVGATARRLVMEREVDHGQARIRGLYDLCTIFPLVLLLLSLPSRLAPSSSMPGLFSITAERGLRDLGAVNFENGGAHGITPDLGRSRIEKRATNRRWQPLGGCGLPSGLGLRQSRRWCPPYVGSPFPVVPPRTQGCGNELQKE